MNSLSTMFTTILVLTAEWTQIGVAGDCFGVNSGFDLTPGKNDMKSQGGIDLAGCCNLCKATPGCKAWVWGKVLSICWLKSVAGAPKADGNKVSGYPDDSMGSDPTAQCSAVNSGLNISPGSNDITSFVIDIAGCCRACNANPACKAYVWTKSSGKCWLKSVDVPRVKGGDSISGTRGGGVVTPTPAPSTCGTDADFENSSPAMACYDECSKGDAAVCSCCKSKGAQGGKCFNSVPYCWPPIPVVTPTITPPTTTCGTDEDFENSSPAMACYDQCSKGDDAVCSCCKSKGAQGGKCFNSVPYCWPPIPVTTPAVPPPPVTCGTDADYENASPKMQCYDVCAQGDAAVCKCCKDNLARGGKCFSGVPYCFA